MAICAMAGCRDRRAAPTVAEADAAAAAWRTKHEADYRRDWASISGLATLKPGVNTAGSAATNDIVLPDSTPATVGRFVLGDAGVRFEPAPGAGVLLDKSPVSGPIDLRDDGAPEVDELTIGEVRLVVHLSGDRRTLRIRDPNGPLARGFAGFTWFPIDSSYRVVGRFVPDAQPQHLRVVNTYADVDTYLSEGVVEFTLQGQTVRLRPFTTRPKRLYFVFRDASSGIETVQDGALPLLRSEGRRNHRARFQRGLQPALRVQPVHHVSDPPARESAADQGSGGRARLRRWGSPDSFRALRSR